MPFLVITEVPKESLEFCIKSFGGRVSWEIGKENDVSITHHIVDRNQLLGQRVLSRDYVQPQWVYDCINARVLIPSEEYQPGNKLPPHLSPFIDDYAEGYIPEYRKKLDQLYKEHYGLSTLNSTEPVPINEEDEESDEEARYAEDLAAEKEGKYGTSNKKLRKLAVHQTKKDEEEIAVQHETAEALLTRRKRRLLQRIKYSKRMKQEAIQKLEDKKQKLKEGKAKLEGKSTIVYTQED